MARIPEHYHRDYLPSYLMLVSNYLIYVQILKQFDVCIALVARHCAADNVTKLNGALCNGSELSATLSFSILVQVEVSEINAKKGTRRNMDKKNHEKFVLRKCRHRVWKSVADTAR